jgi:hypothetical protein
MSLTINYSSGQGLHGVDPLSTSRELIEWINSYNDITVTGKTNFNNDIKLSYDNLNFLNVSIDSEANTTLDITNSYNNKNLSEFIFNNKININNGLTVQGDSIIGSDMNDILIVNSDTKFTNNVELNGNFTTTNGDFTTTNGDFTTTNGKISGYSISIQGDSIIGSDMNDILIVNSDTKFTDNIEVSNSITTKNAVFSGNIRGTNVGIGASPGTRLTIYGEDSESVASRLIATFTDKISQNEWTGIGLGGYLQVCKSGIIHERTDNYGRGSLHLCTNNTADATNINKNDTRLTITATGNVGIGTDNPISELYVNGNVTATGSIRGTDISYGSSWSQLGSDIDGEAAGDYSGNSVSLSSDGTIVAIGANGNDGNGNNSGHVRVYEYSGSSWSQLGSDIDGEADNDYSGLPVSLSSDGTIVAIGATGNDGTSGSSTDNRGHVRVYQYSGSSWSQLGSDIDGEAGSDQSGYSVSLSSDGTIVAIGAYKNDGNKGHVRVYQYSGSSWSQLGSDIDGEAGSDQSGYSVSLSSDGTIVAIGAYKNDGNGNNSGHVRVYQYSGSSWSQLGSDIDGEAGGDGSGRSVSLSSDGTIVAIGAHLNDGNGINSGHVRVYQYSGSSWSQLGSDIDGEVAGDESGFSVSLSSDGTIVAIGAYLNDGTSSSSTDNRGHVRVYQYSGSSWSQLGSDIDGEAGGDASGNSVSLSSDGTIVAIGANYNDGNRGHVRVYQIPTTTNLNVDSNLIVSGDLILSNISRFFHKNIYVETDTSNRTFSTSWADGKEFTLKNYSANSKLLVHVYVPCRNSYSGWGGGYHDLQYNINSSGYKKLGQSGYTSVMNSNGQDIGFWSNMFYLNLNITSSFTCQFKLRHRSYDNTLYVNQSTDVNSGDANDYNIDINQNYTKLIIQELG